VAGARNASGLGVGVTTATDEWGIADAPRIFATGAAGRSAGEKIPFAVNGDGAHGALLVPHVMFSRVRIFQTTLPGDALARMNEFFSRKKRQAILDGKFFRAAGYQHHVFTFFENQPRQANRILYVFHGSDRAGFQGLAVHYDRVELNVAISIQVRAEARVKRGIVFEDDNGAFHCVDRATGLGQNFPACFESATNSRAAVRNCFVRNIPCATVNDERRFQAQVTEKK